MTLMASGNAKRAINHTLRTWENAMSPTPKASKVKGASMCPSPRLPAASAASTSMTTAAMPPKPLSPQGARGFISKMNPL